MNYITFPKLGLEFNIDPIAFTILGRPIYWYALIIVAGFILGTLFVCKTCKKRGVNPDNMLDIGLYGLIFGIICARIYYVIFSWDEYSGNLSEIFRIWEGGLAIYGGIIGGILTALVYCRIKKLDTAKVFDCAAPGLFIGQAIGRYGNFVNCEVYGRATDFVAGMCINGAEPVHPLFFYESVWNIIGLILLIIFRDKKKADGQVFCFYIAWYSLGRFFLEGLRQPQYVLYLVKDVIAVSQAVAVIGVIAGIAGMIFLYKRRNNAGV